MQVDSEEAGDYYADDECVELDNLDSLGNDEMYDVADEDRQAQSANTSQYQLCAVSLWS